jgi:hypothetical protein
MTHTREQGNTLVWKPHWLQANHIEDSTRIVMYVHTMEKITERPRFIIVSRRQKERLFVHTSLLHLCAVDGKKLHMGIIR